MRPSRFLLRSATLAIAAATIACGDAPTGPSAPRGSTSLLGGVLGPVLGLTGNVVGALIRPAPLARDITVSTVIGPNGGRLSIPAAGVTVTVPQGAVSSDVRFTMTAVAGRMYAYEFGPHGMQFAKPLTVVQNVGILGGVVRLLTPGAGYFADRSALNMENFTATVSETLPATTNLLAGTVTFQVRHFSGYMVSSGRSAE